MLMRVGLATVLGIAIGIERQWRSRMAGLQTMALVSMGSALFLILGGFAFGGRDAPLRVAAQIVSGIGFLGAGVIMKQGLSVTGLNTAATLWSTAAVGALAGAWMWREAITGAFIIVAANGLLQPLAAVMDRKPLRGGRETPPADYVFDVTCRSGATNAVRTLVVETIARPGFQLKGLRSSASTDPAQTELRAEVTAAKRDDTVFETAVSQLSGEADVSSARWSIRNEQAADWGR
ncbi:MAG: hypothetical protein JWR37_1239 [Mycobacterium sp.]|nr:hypothetical protein [Mycobacterium sp.]